MTLFKKGKMPKSTEGYELPAWTFNPDDEETMAIVRLVYHRCYYVPESEMTRTRILNCWYPVKISGDLDGSRMRQLVDRIKDQFVIDFSYTGRGGGLAHLKFRSKYLYFRSGKDASMAKLTFS